MGTPLVQLGSPSAERRSASKAAQKAEAYSQLAEKSLRGSYNEKVADILQSHSYNFVLSDPTLPDNPIVYASQGFLSMTGYSREEIIGRNCRFLQGPDTDRRTVLMIREACREERAVQVRILNYTKDGKPFWNLFHMAPIFCSETGKVVHYIGVQTPISQSLAKSPAFTSSGAPSPVGKPPLPPSPRPANGPPTPPPSTASPRLGSPEPETTVEDTVQIAVPMELIGGSAEPDLSPPEDRVKALTAVKAVVGDLKTCGEGKVEFEKVSRGEPLDPKAARVVCSSLVLTLTKIQQSFVLANPNLEDCPIVHASDVFLELTGYPREEVVGRNCRFLQGPETEPESVREIREAIAADKPCTVRLLNYRKDGTPFWNNLHVSPIRNACGKVVYYCGVQLDVTAADGISPLDRGMSSRLKQLGAVGAVRVAVRALDGSGLRRNMS
ncbi:PAS/LOV protein [Klebsormidium nitens]|uniref:PAS/LOV protein n=1 Tax=Klebsormidium nitens TaxID=105231 RepID=A0A1Y1HXM9_KLENI|nr:PAS/LOV protein [Klebsormidium nitens]|eukprot:GAQ81276.1 PAS/LOV protein [Klebsormidium nitens]